MSAAVECKNLTKVFSRRGERDNRVLEDISLTIPDNAFTVIIGPSGSGKTTLLNLMAGFEMPTSGVVLRDGVTVTAPSQDCGFIFQTPALYPWYSVLDNVLFGPRALGKDKDPSTLALANDLIAEVKLSSFARARPYELSGGMRSRVALVRALINKPKLLLMDEPFAALDAHTRASMQELVLRLHDHHKSTTVFVTHDIDEALLLGDVVIVLSTTPGRIKDVIDVPLGRPRSYEMVDEPEFVKLRRGLRAKVWGGDVSPRLALDDKQSQEEGIAR